MTKQNWYSYVLMTLNFPSHPSQSASAQIKPTVCSCTGSCWWWNVAVALSFWSGWNFNTVQSWSDLTFFRQQKQFIHNVRQGYCFVGWSADQRFVAITVNTPCTQRHEAGRGGGLLQLFLTMSIVMPVTQPAVKHGRKQCMQSFPPLYCYRHRRYSFLCDATKKECTLATLWGRLSPWCILCIFPSVHTGLRPKASLLFDVLIVHCL